MFRYFKFTLFSSKKGSISTFGSMGLNSLLSTIGILERSKSFLILFLSISSSKLVILLFKLLLIDSVLFSLFELFIFFEWDNDLLYTTHSLSITLESLTRILFALFKKVDPPSNPPLELFFILFITCFVLFNFIASLSPLTILIKLWCILPSLLYWNLLTIFKSKVIGFLNVSILIIKSFIVEHKKFLTSIFFVRDRKTWYKKLFVIYKSYILLFSHLSIDLFKNKSSNNKYIICINSSCIKELFIIFS